MVVEASPQAQAFSLRTPLLSAGRSMELLAATDRLKVRIKVYAEGGENGVHTHNDEDHAFVILQGQATFYDADDNATVLNPYEGTMLPRGAFYRFASTGDENLVLLRIGTGDLRRRAARRPSGAAAHPRGKRTRRRRPDSRSILPRVNQAQEGGSLWRYWNGHIDRRPTRQRRSTR